MKIMIVPKNEIVSHWRTPVKLTPDFTENDFDAEWEVVRDALRDALEDKWTESLDGDTDFMVMDDRNLAWTQCGGIYSRRICCPEYVSVISDVLAGTRRPHLWAYHTIAEIRDLPTDTWRRQFIVRPGCLILPDDGFDYTPFIGK